MVVRVIVGWNIAPQKYKWKLSGEKQRSYNHDILRSGVIVTTYLA
jgi:hypothetical protein